MQNVFNLKRFMALCFLLSSIGLLFLFTFTEIYNINNQNDLWKMNKEQPLILYWTSFFGDDLVTMQQPPLKENLRNHRRTLCETAEHKNDGCVFSSIRADIDRAHAVIFHGPNFWEAMPLNVSFFDGKIRTFLTMETAHNTGGDYPKNFFHWTITPHHLSTIPSMYGPQQVLPSNARNSDIPPLPNVDATTAIAGKDVRGALWFVSHCNTASRREEAVRLLKKHFRVDIGGRCPNSTIHCARGSMACDQLVNRYYFYMALENDMCEDYVTEKFWDCIKQPVVLIVQKRAIYKKRAPPGSFIAMDDFSGPKAMAAHLNWLMDNPAAYAEHFRWRTRTGWAFVSDKQSGYCKMCAMIRQMKTEARQQTHERDDEAQNAHTSVLRLKQLPPVIPDINAWYRGVLNCTPGQAFLDKWRD